jgi:hypothetical protein
MFFNFIAYKLSQPLYQLKNILFAHCVPFISMTMDMYIILLQGWKNYVHMMCIIPMINPFHLGIYGLLLPSSPNSIWKVGWYCCINGHHWQCSPHAKLHSTHGDCLFHQPRQLTFATIPWLKMQISFHPSNIENCWYFLLKGHVLLLLGDYINYTPTRPHHPWSYTKFHMGEDQIQTSWSLG